MNRRKRKLINKINEVTFYACLNVEHSKGWLEGYRAGLEQGRIEGRVREILRKEKNEQDNC